MDLTLILTIAGLVIAVVIGVWQIRLAQKQINGENNQNKNTKRPKEQDEITPDQFKAPFIIRMTKAQFERELEKFVNDDTVLPYSLLLGWRILKHRKTTKEIDFSLQMNDENKYWQIVSNIEEADAIKLSKEPYRGLMLEVLYQPEGLWVTVNPEGDRESITVTETMVEKKKRRRGIGFVHKGWRKIPVNQDSYVSLLKWLDSISIKP